MRNPLTSDTSPIEIKTDSQTGCFLIHGFTAAPEAMRGLAKTLRNTGYSCRAPLLLGHGTRVEDLNKVTWQDIEKNVEQDFLNYVKGFDKCVIVGESSGGVIGLRLAAKYPKLVSGIATVGASLIFRMHPFLQAVAPFYKRILPITPKAAGPTADDPEAASKRVTYKAIPVHAFHGLLKYARDTQKNVCINVRAPLLVMQSARERTVSKKSVDFICKKTSSEYHKVVWFQKSGHLLLIDYEKDNVYKEIVDFVKGIDNGTIK